MKFKLKIEIIGNKASVFLLDKKRNIISRSTWIDKRNLSEKLLRKIDLLLRKNELVIKDIENVDFECDSPYYKKSKKISFDENISSKNKCGFTSWQIGEITAKVLNFAIDEN
ncbi:MAG: hypothetical protein KAS78_03105 [Candidatus Pacebacteria bacterium]|nr:hypothetical protein [Candidatus Paceibacterota bacterium]